MRTTLSMVRYKNRYLLVQWKFSSVEVGGKTLKDTNAKNLLVFLKEAMQTFHGDYGLACVQHALNVKYLNVSTLVTILRCPRAHHRAVWSALTAITSYHGEPCTLTLLHLGGTIQSTQKALIRYNTVTLKKAMHCATSHNKKKEAENKLKKVLEKDLIPLKV